MTWKKTLQCRSIEMSENLVDVRLDSHQVLIYATFQSIAPEIEPLITNVLIHLRNWIDLIEIHLERFSRDIFFFEENKSLPM